MEERKEPRSSLRPVLITAICLTLSISLTFLFFRGVESPSLFSTNILVVTLVNLNITLSILLLLLLSRNLIKFYFERKREPNKSSLKSKLIAALVGLSMIPSILLFVVASGLLTSSVENWFSIQVENSLDQSLEVAQDYYQETQNRVAAVSEQIGHLLLQRRRLKGSHNALVQFLEGRKKEHGFHNIYLFTPQYKPFAETSNAETGATLDSFRPTPEFLKEILALRLQEGGIDTEFAEPAIMSTPQGDLIRGVLPLKRKDRVTAILVVDHLIPSLLVEKMVGIKKSVEEYKQLKAFKNPIKGSYILSFLIIVLVIIFSATWFGLYLARSITVPIQKLAEGTQAVADGDLNFQIHIQARDELGILVDSFNKMTTNLKESQRKIGETTRSLSATNRELAGLLDNIAAGVISINEKGVITTFNPSAEQILDIRADEAIQQKYTVFFLSRDMEGMTKPLQKLEKRRKDSLEEEVTIEVRKQVLTLRIAFTVLQGPGGNALGFVIVFDDVTELIRAQKLATWQEVAQRIAHEIRNPLTPIQLSTERLRKKYFQGSDDFDKIFDESTQIVINEVNGLKTLVDEFSYFARMPTPRCRPERIYPIIREVVSLYETGHKDISVKINHDFSVPEMSLDREQIKRVLMNLFKNAVDAMDDRGTVIISTVYDGSKKKVRLDIEDEGLGIPPEDLDKLFLPYFSRKKSGTGLGLAIVNRIVTDHNAQIRVAPRLPKGTTFTIEFPV
ncbi:HAMP domain-containing protein [Nitrospira defluvii]|nr:HAMP domain-containing protein [Nitrospira defluvii]